jgi:hypothetical protein
MLVSIDGGHGGDGFLVAPTRFINSSLRNAAMDVTSIDTAAHAGP